MRPAHAASPPCAEPEVARRGADRRRQHAGHRVQRAVERQLAQGGELADLLARQHLHRREHGKRDRQVEMAALLQQVGGCEIDQHAARRQGEAHRGQRRPHPLARLAHRLVRQSHDEEGGQAGGDLHLHLDRHRLDAGKREGLDTSDGHAPPLATLRDLGTDWLPRG